jgi:hypothetical protein
MNTIAVVTVEDRMDGVYAFTSMAEAERFMEAVIRNGGGNCTVDALPLNESADVLIEAERDD